MNFIVSRVSKRRVSPKAPQNLPCVVLQQDNWDDYTYKTTFSVFYFDPSGLLSHVGDTKILHDSDSTTELPDSFHILDGHYCSLGQDIEYYNNWIRVAGIDTARNVLTAVRDVVVDPNFRVGFSESDGFKHSLLRFSEAEKAYKEAGTLFGHMPITDSGMSMSFECRLDGFDENHLVDLDFSNDSVLPHRLICFVGKNGTGKSGVLSKLALSLSGWSQAAGRFTPGQPLFSRVLCFSYSAFQPFRVPYVNSTSYRYFGLFQIDTAPVDAQTEEVIDTTSTNEDDIFSVAKAHDIVLESIKAIHEQDRIEVWRNLLGIQDLFGSDVANITARDGIDSFVAELRKLSSGQQMVVSLFTNLVAHIRDQSLVLLDEPETYLHPTLTSTFLQLLRKLLNEFDSYAIIATHSPIVVQEVPSRSVRVFARQGSIPIQEALPIESLGANLTEIVDHVFMMNDDDKNYRNILEELIRNKTLEEVNALFDGRLTLNARAYLASLQGHENS